MPKNRTDLERERSIRVYWIVGTSMVIYNFALIVFSLSPLLPDPNPLLFLELFIAALSITAIAGSVLHALEIDHGRFSPARWWYAMTGTAGTIAILGFLVGEVDNAAPITRFSISLFLLVGAMIAYGAHVEWGGRPVDHERV